MCGIAGYLGPREIPPRRLQECLALMRRRGPDHAAVFHHRRPDGDHLYLLHSRLSIIDLDPRAHQPFERGPRVLAYNGELYNYLELKAELERRGERFHTTSDTEVLLALLAREGDQALDRCEGMWAFALYHRDSGALWLCRDRFGEKPLYLHQDREGLYFASEPKMIFALRGRRLPVNYRHLYRFLVNGYKSLYKQPETFFQDLEELPAATLLTLEPGRPPRRRRYWQPRVEPREDMTWEEAVEGTRQALIRAVKLRLRADVPLAFCMSGGIDSNALISIAKNVFHYDVHGFTIVNTDERYAEWDLVELAVRQQELRHTAIPIRTQGFLEGLRELVRYHDAPVYTITYYAHWLLMESIARHGYRISVSGTGADELFTGYYDHHNAYLYEVRHDPELFARSLADWERHVGGIVRNPLLQNPRCFIHNPEQREHIYLNNHRFASFLRGDYRPEPFREEPYARGLLRRRMLNELFHESVPVILHEDDLNAMYYSIENRSPYLDRHLMEFAYRIPTRHLIRQGRAKAVLREAMRGIVPDPILDNPRKVGFNAPIFDFLDVRDPQVRAYLLDDSPIYQHLRRESIRGLLDKPSLPNSESKFLFYFLGCKMFLEEFGP